MDILIFQSQAKATYNEASGLPTYEEAIIMNRPMDQQSWREGYHTVILIEEDWYVWNASIHNFPGNKNLNEFKPSFIVKEGMKQQAASYFHPSIFMLFSGLN